MKRKNEGRPFWNQYGKRFYNHQGFDGNMPNRFGGDMPNRFGGDMPNRFGGDMSNRFGGDWRACPPTFPPPEPPMPRQPFMDPQPLMGPQPLMQFGNKDLRSYVNYRRDNRPRWRGPSNAFQRSSDPVGYNSKVPDNDSDTKVNRKYDGVNFTVTMKKELSTAEPVVVVKPCDKCPDDPYLICQGETESVVASLKINQPRFIQENVKFIKSHRLHASMKIYCNNCSSGPMNDWDNSWEHFTGKNHKRKVSKESNPFMKIVLCSNCLKVWCYTLPQEEPCERQLPQDLGEIFSKIYPTAKPKMINNEEPKKVVESNDKKPGDLVKLIFSDINRVSGFDEVYAAAMAFGKKHWLDLQSLLLVIKPTDQVAICKFAKANRSFGHNFDRNNAAIIINGAAVKGEVVSTFDGIVDKMKEQNFRILQWTRGSISPSCEIFQHWDSLCQLVGSKLWEMNKTLEQFDCLTASIVEDIRRVTAGRYTVNSVDFFGSRVTGLAITDSDFDLQLSTREACTVRSLCDKCFNGSPWFKVQHVIPWAKVPVIKVLHSKTQSVCDISLNNFNGVVNSRLLRFYLEMDERVKWLVVTVKMWASMNAITGSFAFTSYTLAWLVMFFLMQENVSLVPPVALLENLPCRDWNTRLISYDTGLEFTLDMRELIRVHNPKKKCNMSKYELLIAFFTYCIEIISLKKIALDPYTGQVMTRQTLGASDRRKQTEGNLNNDKNLRSYSLIIVDPIKHSCNICGSVNKTLMSNFVTLAQETLNLLSSSPAK